MINIILLSGRFCNDPEIRQTQNGKSICRFRLAVDRNRKSENGQRQADFISCVCWERTAEFVSKYFKKGSMAIVEGRLQNADYTDQNGVKHYAMEVIVSTIDFGERKAAEPQQANNPQQQAYYQQQPTVSRR